MRRRTFIAGTVAGAALLAGCSGSGNDGGGGSGGGGKNSGKSGYSVRMAPVGKVEFDAPPESVAHYFPGYADMAVALGHADSIDSIGYKSRYHTSYYDSLDGVSVDKKSLTELYQSGLSKEVFYQLDSDLHMIDPRWLSGNFKGFEGSDVRTISSKVAPFFGNTIFRRTDAWHDYRYYTMYQAFRKVAKVHREEPRYQRFKEFHDAFVADVQSKLPSARKRPNGLLCYAASDQPETFSPYRLAGKGTNKKQFHDLGIADALAKTGVEGLSTTQRGKIDYETMLEVDPDSILVRGHETKTRAEFENTVLAFMKGHETASKLTAVTRGDVFRGGPIYEGPIQNLFLTERFAKRYFPDVYSGKLFDRGKLADIVTA